LDVLNLTLRSSKPKSTSSLVNKTVTNTGAEGKVENLKLKCLFLREEHGLRPLENKVLRKVFGPRRNEVPRTGENYMKMKFILYTLQTTLLL
jgi:hypothetical protein